MNGFTMMLFSNLTDIAKMLIVDVLLLDYKVTPKKRSFIAEAIIIAAEIILMPVTGLIKADGSKGEDLLHIVTMLAVPVIIAMSLEGRHKYLISAAAYLGICLIDDALLSSAAAVVGRDRSFITLSFGRKYLLFLIEILVMLAVSLAVRHFRGSAKRIQNSSISYILFFILSIVLTYLIYIATINADSEQTILLLLLLGVVLMFSTAALLRIHASEKHYSELSRLGEKLNEAQKEYYEQRLAREEDTRKFRHDIKNLLLCLQTLLDEGKTDEAKTYISEMVNRTESHRPVIATGNDLVNAIAGDLICRYGSVELKWEGMLPNELGMAGTDICIIFSNLLDNAFAAASKCSNGKVGVRAGIAGSSLVLTVKNDIAEPIDTKGSRLVTKKADKERHGYGTVNVMECAESHGGEARFSFDDDTFTAEVILPDVIIR